MTCTPLCVCIIYTMLFCIQQNAENKAEGNVSKHRRLHCPSAGSMGETHKIKSGAVFDCDLAQQSLPSLLGEPVEPHNPKHQMQGCLPMRPGLEDNRSIRKSSTGLHR